MSDNFKIDYDEENDLLFLYDEKEKSGGSIEFGDLIIDLKRDGKIVGMEIFGASNYFSELTDRKISVQDLKKIEKVKFTVIARKGTMMIKIILPLEKENIQATIAIQDINYSSPAMAFAE